MNSDNNTLTEVENENEKIMMSHIKKIIIEQKTNDAEDITNKLRRKYDKYNLKKRKYVKKIVQKVLSSLREENNSNDSVGMEEMFAAEKNGNSTAAAASARECATENKNAEKRSESMSDDVNVTDEESETQANNVLNQLKRKRSVQNFADELFNSVSKSVTQKRLCMEKPKDEKKLKVVELGNFMESPAIDRTENFSKIIGRIQVIAEVKECFSVIRMREIVPSIGQLHLIFAAPTKEGKRSLAKAVAAEYDLKFCEINFSNIIQAIKTENFKIDFYSILSECANRKTLLYFSNLQEIDAEHVPSFVVDKIMSSFLDFVIEMKKNLNVFVIGGFKTCSKRYSVSESLYKFDRVIYFNIPTMNERLEIFQYLIKKYPQFDFKMDNEWMVRNSPRYLLYDTIKLFQAVLMAALKDRCSEASEPVAKVTIDIDVDNGAGVEAPDSTSVSDASKKPTVTEEHFFNGLEQVRPHVSLDQQTIDPLPKTSWDDIGSLKSVKNTIRCMISRKLNSIDTGCQGVLLYGPPGCGKTLIAKALANENGFYFISVRGAEFMNKYVGDSQKAVHACFNRATKNAPSIIFFDEFDAICGDRSKFDSNVANQVSAALLTEMDGFHKRNVFIVAATNRIDIVDKAFLRPGRFSRILYVGLPSSTERLDILKTICKSKQIQLCDDVDLEAIANHEQCTNYSGADLSNLIVMAQEIVYERDEPTAEVDIKINQESLLDALRKTDASVSSHDLLYYRDYENKRSEL